MSPRLQKIVMATCLVALVTWMVSQRQKPPRKAESPLVKIAASKIKPRSSAPIADKLTGPAKRKEMTLKDMDQGLIPGLNRLEVDEFLKNHGRSTANLIAASRLLNDPALLREAVQAAPTDPAAQLELALRGETPEEKQVGVDAFRKLAPDNSLGDYLAANLAFKQGDFGAAGGALLQSLDNPLLADYSQSIADAKEVAYLDAGYDPVVAKASALLADGMYQLKPLMDVRDGVKMMQDEFIRTADFDSAEPTVIIGLTLGQRIQAQSPLLIDQLVGISIERTFLQQLDPITQAGPNGITAGERLEALDAKLLEVRALTAQLGNLGELTPAAQAEYLQKVSQEGELAAARWFAAQNSQGK